MVCIRYIPGIYQVSTYRGSIFTLGYYLFVNLTRADRVATNSWHSINHLYVPEISNSVELYVSILCHCTSIILPRDGCVPFGLSNVAPPLSLIRISDPLCTLSLASVEPLV